MMALRNRCCTEEEAKHKHDFDWLLEATTKVTIYISVTQLYKSAKQAVEKQRGKEKPRRNPSLNFLPPCVIYMHATLPTVTIKLEKHGLGCMATIFLLPSLLPLSFYPSSVLPLLPSSEKSGMCEAFGSEPLDSNQLPEQKRCTQVAYPVSLPSRKFLSLIHSLPLFLPPSILPFMLSSHPPPSHPPPFLSFLDLISAFHMHFVSQSLSHPFLPSLCLTLSASSIVLHSVRTSQCSRSLSGLGETPSS